MRVSGIGAGISAYGYQRAVDGRSAQFAGMMASASENTAVAASSATQVSVSPNRSDFTSMTPQRFEAEAKAMYDRGEIDLHTLGVMQMRAWSSASQQASTRGTGTVDFVKIFQDNMQFLLSSGMQNDPKSSYATYKAILSKIS